MEVSIGTTVVPIYFAIRTRVVQIKLAILHDGHADYIRKSHDVDRTMPG